MLIYLMYIPSVSLVVAAEVPNPNPAGLVPKTLVEGAVLVSACRVELAETRRFGRGCSKPPNPVDAALVAAREKI